jgi:hypothetical protein
MVLYGLGLWGQTLLALAALGLTGGWALWPFRRADRPYLWLAAPLAGLAVLSLALCLLHFGCRLPLPRCLAVAGPLLAAPTLALLARRARAGGRVEGWRWAVAAALAASALFTLGSNSTAIRLREPTVCMRDGTDAVGYSLFADWFLRHPGEKPDYSQDKPNEAFIAADYQDTRPGAFLLAAAAAWARRTTPLFSYDWANGVAMACAALGLAGAFASGRRGLLLLLAAAALSSWFPTSRSGYLGKTLCYPGCLLLCFAFWEAYRRPGAARLLAAGVLGAGVGLCLHAMVPQLVLGLVVVGLGMYLVAQPLLGPAAPGGPPRRPDLRLLLAVGLIAFATAFSPPPTTFLLSVRLLAWRQVPYPEWLMSPVSVLGWLLPAAAVALALCWLHFFPGRHEGRKAQYARLSRAAWVFAVMAGPGLVYILWATPNAGCPNPPLPWDRLTAIALDLDSSVLPVVSPERLPWLMGGALALNAALLLLALWARDGEAVSYLACTGLLPAAWLLGKTHVYEFHGLLFPLTAAGAVLLAQRPRQASRPLGYAALALAALLVGLRGPQAWGIWPRYTRGVASSPACYARSEIDAVAALVAGQTVDVAVPDPVGTLFLMAELTARGTPPRFREPSWTLALAFTTWKAPELPRAGDFLVADARAWAPPETLRLRSRHYAVSAAEGGLSLLCVGAPYYQHAPDPQGRPGFWLGGTAVAIDLWNGTGQPQRATFVAEGTPGPCNPDASRRTVRYALGGRAGAQALSAANGWRLAAPLELPPGPSRLTLAVEEPMTAPLGPNDPRELMLLLGGPRLGPPPEDYRPGAAAPAAPSPLTQE